MATNTQGDKTSRQVFSRNSNLSTNETTNDESGKAPVKRLPPIKAPVGIAKGPDLKNCKSKVGSLHNIKHTPTGGGVTIPSQKLAWNAKSKVGSLENKEHKPGGGTIKVETRKLEWKTGSKIQSLQNVNHKPGGGNVKIFNEAYVEKSTTNKKPSSPSSTSPNDPASLLNNGAPSKDRKDDGVYTKSLNEGMKGLSLIN